LSHHTTRITQIQLIRRLVPFAWVSLSIRSWTEQSKRCPLCNQPINHLLHRLTPDGTDSQRYFPLPLFSPIKYNSTLSNVTSSISNHIPSLQSPVTEINTQVESQALGLDARKFVYQNLLYSKHIPSNSYTRFKPISCKDFQPNNSNSGQLISRTTKFLSRELRVFDHLNGRINQSISYVILILKSLDCNSVGAIRLFSELLRSATTAEHFSHELTCFLRSPFDNLTEWDSILQYECLK
ncbi:hypothetical protein O181_058941, partial [Austropuccinia psidii MF-1]|nr:hypothetical protein [Austropuccinia psidii MF-1]